MAFDPYYSSDEEEKTQSDLENEAMEKRVNLSLKKRKNPLDDEEEYAREQRDKADYPMKGSCDFFLRWNALERLDARKEAEKEKKRKRKKSDNKMKKINGGKLPAFMRQVKKKRK